mmetsp:Transcript_13996/g.29536  ORF Transcript_13996/g.29536 Transcript_13996/m.29536 type:complete len:191 (-) Transcript_13996:41-613(-)
MMFMRRLRLMLVRMLMFKLGLMLMLMLMLTTRLAAWTSSCKRERGTPTLKLRAQVQREGWISIHINCSGLCRPGVVVRLHIVDPSKHWELHHFVSRPRGPLRVRARSSTCARARSHRACTCTLLRSPPPHTHTQLPPSRTHTATALARTNLLPPCPVAPVISRLPAHALAACAIQRPLPHSATARAFRHR